MKWLYVRNLGPHLAPRKCTIQFSIILKKNSLLLLLQLTRRVNNAKCFSEWRSVCPSPRQMSTVMLHLKSCPNTQCILSAAPLPSSEPGPQDKVTGFVRMLLFRDRRSRWHWIGQNSPTCATPPHPQQRRNFLLLFLKYICTRNQGHTWGSSWIMFFYQNITEMKIFSYKALLPNPTLHLHIFNPSEHWLTASKTEENLRVVLLGGGAFFLMKEVTHVGGGVPSAA